uniref:G_PROTEIN_RECEP_F1_2 domain-containing protein n=1 Tax=Steinernema glaseri TaxID=37863 RepID=A0A1I8AH83_9BILA
MHFFGALMLRAYYVGLMNECVIGRLHRSRSKNQHLRVHLDKYKNPVKAELIVRVFCTLAASDSPDMNNTFVFASELIGREVPNHLDRLIGGLIFTFALLAVTLGIYNLVIIKHMEIFHNAFGWFWASRTVGEVGCNMVHLLYSGPMTFFVQQIHLHTDTLFNSPRYNITTKTTWTQQKLMRNLQILALIVFNPEVRSRITGYITSSIAPNPLSTTEVVARVILRVHLDKYKKPVKAELIIFVLCTLRVSGFCDMVGDVNETFVFASELIGREVPNHLDRIIGGLIFTFALLAVTLGIYNLFIIKRMEIFHNAFGWFWASRTVGEVGCNMVHLLYSGPMTFFQFRGFPPSTGIVMFTIAYFFGCHACVMHQIISLNRMIAVCFPLKYPAIFQSNICKFLIGFCWVQVVFVVMLYLVIPCQMVGFSPKMYEYVFVKCGPMERDFSYVGTIVNRFCFVVCFSTIVADIVTLVRIIMITRSGAVSKNLSRDIRFFFQTSVQNITMMVALTMIVIVNNSPDGVYMQILGFLTLMVTHITNTLALIIFNPEISSDHIQPGSSDTFHTFHCFDHRAKPCVNY